jgi:hypothetical protein
MSTEWTEIARMWKESKSLEQEMWARCRADDHGGTPPPRIKDWVTSLVGLLPPSLWSGALHAQIQLISAVWEHVRIWGIAVGGRTPTKAERKKYGATQVIYFKAFRPEDYID